MPDIRSSEIKQVVSPICEEARNASADAKGRASHPNERTRLTTARRTASSSSTIETIRPAPIRHSSLQCTTQRDQIYIWHVFMMAV
jgi:ribosomal protein S10